MEFLKANYPGVEIKRLDFKPSNFSKLTDQRSRLLINDSEGEKFYLQDLKSRSVVEYSLSIVTRYFKFGEEPRLLKKHVFGEYVYLFFKKKLIVCNMTLGKILKLVNYNAQKVMISSDESFFLVISNPFFCIYNRENLELIIQRQMERNFKKFDIRNRINGYWLFFGLDNRRVLIILGFVAGEGSSTLDTSSFGDKGVKKLAGLDDVVDFVVTDTALYVLHSYSLVKYSLE